MITEIINDTFDENTRQTINLNEHLSNSFDEVEIFLKVIQDKRERHLSKIIDEYMHLLEQRRDTSLPKFSIEKFTPDYSNFQILKKYPKLMDKLEQSIFYHMNIREYEDNISPDGDVDLSFSEFYRSYFMQTCLLGLTLSSLFSREEALELCKTQNIAKWESAPPKEIETLEEFEGKDNYDREILTHRRHGLMGEGRYILKIERCLYGEVMRDFDDLEIADSLECYIDYILPVKKNKNFVMTRTKTIMKGDSWCDICYHDKRIVEKVEHPSDEFWENFKMH